MARHIGGAFGGAVIPVVTEVYGARRQWRRQLAGNWRHAVIPVVIEIYGGAARRQLRRQLAGNWRRAVIPVVTQVYGARRQLRANWRQLAAPQLLNPSGFPTPHRQNSPVSWGSRHRHLPPNEPNAMLPKETEAPDGFVSVGGPNVRWLKETKLDEENLQYTIVTWDRQRVVFDMTAGEIISRTTVAKPWLNHSPILRPPMLWRGVHCPCRPSASLFAVLRVGCIPIEVGQVEGVEAAIFCPLQFHRQAAPLKNKLPH